MCPYMVIYAHYGSEREETSNPTLSATNRSPIKVNKAVQMSRILVTTDFSKTLSHHDCCDNAVKPMFKTSQCMGLGSTVR